jgi:hypothetical protein
MEAVPKLIITEQSPFKKDTGWYVVPFFTPLDLMLTCSVNKILIVCPVTLVDNWKKEFKKW